MADEFDDVDAYLAAAVPEARPHLEALRALMRSAAPGVEESIKWNVPYYEHRGELGGFSVASKHVTFGFGGDVLADADRRALEADGYRLGKQTLQIRFGQPVPTEAITKILATTVDRNEADADR